MSTHTNSRLVPHQSETKHETKHETKGKQVVNVRTCVQLKEYVHNTKLVVLHFTQSSYDIISGWSCVYVLGCALSNQVHHPTISDGLEEMLTDVNVRESSCACFNQEDTETEDVHFGRLSWWKLCLRGGIGGVARDSCLQFPDKVDWTVVGYFCPPGVVGGWIQKDIGTADVSMDDGIWFHQVEVVEGPGHIETDGDDLLLWEVSLSENSSQTGGHQLCQDNELTKKGGSDELE